MIQMYSIPSFRLGAPSMPKSRKRNKRPKRRAQQQMIFDLAAEMLRRCSDDLLPVYMLIYGWRVLAPRQAHEVYRCLLFVEALRELGIEAEIWAADRVVMPLPEGLALQPGTKVDLTNVNRAVDGGFGSDHRLVVFVPPLGRLVDLSPPAGVLPTDLPVLGQGLGTVDIRDLSTIAVARPPNLLVYDFGPESEESDRRIKARHPGGDPPLAREVVLPALWTAAKVPGVRARAERNPRLRELLELARERVVDPSKLPPPELELVDVRTYFEHPSEPGHPPAVVMELLSVSRMLLFEPWCSAIGLGLVRRLPDEENGPVPLRVLRGWTVEVEGGVIIRDRWGGLVLQGDSVPEEWRTGVIREGACVLFTGLNLGLDSEDMEHRTKRFQLSATMGWLAGRLAAVTTGRAASLGEFYPITIRPEDFVK
jgi:hypothetical protein